MKLMKAILSLLLVFCSAVVFAQAIDINKATVEQLEGLKGIGPKKAAAIVKYREANGPFESIDDLAKVPGIGKKTLTANKEMLQAGEAATSTMPAVPKTPGMSDMPKTSTMPTM
ncbi:MAG: helix-hairpin-helix domain-containing protein, partial [Phycisphaerales bacterium]|nr:helix-hairpin-helix domain-containing protein [Phycisphaerales bacterium]